MERKFILTLLLVLSAAFLGDTVFGQTPTQMQYSLRLSDQANEELSVRMELRQGSMEGNAVWFQQFDTTTDASGTCTLTLDFSSDIDWGKTPYYIVAITDDKEIGGSILTSVPYALRAASLDGFITKEELVGTWDGIHVGSDDEHCTLTLNEDGTGTYMIRYGESDDSDYGIVHSWLLQNGTLVMAATETETWSGSSVTYARCFTSPTFKLSSTSFYMSWEYLYNAYLFTKKTE